MTRLDPVDPMAAGPQKTRRPDWPDDGHKRVVIEAVTPQVEAGRFPAKRIIGDRVEVNADVFGDGHDQAIGVVLWRRHGDRQWKETRMEPLGNDRWRGHFPVTELGRYEFTVLGWIDYFGTWRDDLAKRVDAGQEVGEDLKIGAAMVQAAAERARVGDAGADAERLANRAEQLADDAVAAQKRVDGALSDWLAALMAAWPDRRSASCHRPALPIEVDRKRARFSSWYEMFPRSCADQSGVHGTFADCQRRLPYIADMGFDVVYFPPIHPIGQINRKGKNNAKTAEESDVGSPWAIGSSAGGHKAVHPKLGTLEEFADLVDRARQFDIDVAVDIALQAAPDHPYVADHPEWFEHRPDGTIQYAENPPKKYEDIYPFDFDTDAWKSLWRACADIFRHWCRQGVRIFRVDNPHTKPFAMWEWLIETIKADFPETIFLAEAFTRPKVMYRLAKVGFSQSYTYFAWRNTAGGLREYLTELTQTGVVEFMRPNFWPNTPDILTDYLQSGRRSAFMVRATLAAMMTANYGIYGPAFELMEHVPASPKSEEYLDSEKYQLRDWDLDSPFSLAEFIGRLNQIRRHNPALQQNRHTTFHHFDNDQLLAFSKRAGDNVILTVVNLDPDHVQTDMIDLDVGALGVAPHATFEVDDLLDDALYTWQGRRNYIELDPRQSPVHVFRIES